MNALIQVRGTLNPYLVLVSVPDLWSTNPYLGLNACHENSKCIDNVGSYHCKCDDGYESDDQIIDSNDDDISLKPGDLICRDINECLDGAVDGATKCQENSQCHNLPGSYECKCVTGYHAVKDECHDTDECDPTAETSLHKCDPGKGVSRSSKTAQT